MLESIIDFNNKVEIINKDLSMYRDNEKGIIFALNTVHLLARLDYIELGIEKDNKTKVSEYEVAKFKKQVEDLDYNEVEKIDIRVKSDITGRKEDSTTIIENPIKAYAIWKVSNSAGSTKCFTNKEEAIKFVEENNKKILEILS